MAFLSSDVPFGPQQQNIAGFLQGPGAAGVGGGQAGQFTLANLLQALSTPNLAGGTAQASDISNILKQFGLSETGAGGAGATTIQPLLQALGLGEYATGSQAYTTGSEALNQAIQTETTGTLPQGAQEIVANNLQQRTAAIKGKYAQLGMTGSSDEANELDQAQRQSLQDQFTISQSLGNLLGGQGLGLISQGLGAFAGGGGLVSGAGNLGAVLAQLGQGALTTAGNLGTTLGTLGISGLNLTQQDYANLAQQGLSSLNIEQGIYGNLANTQIAQDTQTTNLLGAFFKALAGNSGAFGTGGFIPGIQGFFGGGQLPATQASPG